MPAVRTIFHLSLIAMVCLLLPLYGEPLKLALAGEPAELLDWLTSELSQEDSFELLERQELKAISREHEISAGSTLQLMKMFPHADILAILKDRNLDQPGHLVVLNSHNGVRLVDVSWSDKGFSRKDEILEHIRKSRRKYSFSAPYRLSVSDVRLVGLGYWANADPWVLVLEQALMKYDDIQIMERNLLQAITQERRLSEKRFEIATANYTLALEFEGGQHMGTVQVKLICQDRDGKETLRITCDNITGQSRNATIESIAMELVGKLRQSAPRQARTPSEKEEARRIFERLSNIPSTARRLEAIQSAIALDPENELYRHHELPLLASCHLANPRGNGSTWIAESQTVLAACQRFHEDFPDSKLPFIPFKVWRLWGLYNEQIIRTMRDIQNRRGHLTEAESKQELAWCKEELQHVSEFYDSIRHALRDCLMMDKRYGFDFHKQVTSESLKACEEFLMACYFEIGLYVDHDQLMNDYFTELAEYFLQRGKLAAAGHTLKQAKLPPCNAYYEDSWHYYNRHGFIRYFQEHPDYFDRLDKSAPTIDREKLCELKTIWKLVKADSQLNARQAYREYFAEMARIRPNCFDDLQSWKEKLNTKAPNTPFGAVNKHFKWPVNLAWLSLQSYLEHQPGTLLEYLEAACAQQASDTSLLPLLEKARDMRKQHLARLTEKHDELRALQKLAQLIWGGTDERRKLTDAVRTRELSPRQRELFTELNHDVHVEYGTYDDCLSSGQKLVLMDAAFDGKDGIFLLLGEPFPNPTDDSEMKHCLLARLSTIQKPSQNPLRLELVTDTFQVVTNMAKWTPPFSCNLQCNAQYVLVTGGQDRTFLFDRSQRCFLQVARAFDIFWSAKHPILTSEGFLTLDKYDCISYSLDGRNQNIHYAREHLEHNLQEKLLRERLPSFAIPLSDGRTLINYKASRIDELWCLESSKGPLTRKLSLPGTRGCYPQLSQHGQVWLASAEINAGVFFELDTENWRLKEIGRAPKMSYSPADEAQFKSMLNRPNGILPASSVYLLKDHCVWQGDRFSCCLDLNAPDKSPMLWLPYTSHVFEVGDKILFLHSRYWFLVAME